MTSSSDFDTYSTVIGTIVVLSAFVVSTIILMKKPSSSSTTSSSSSSSLERKTKNSGHDGARGKDETSKVIRNKGNDDGGDDNGVDDDTDEDKDVWAARRKKGIAPASLHHRDGAGTTKPFGSSYYYAHNNPNATGGYKDGLRMEDYTMNQPRLLSRGGTGSSVSAASSSSTTPDATATTTSSKAGARNATDGGTGAAVTETGNNGAGATTITAAAAAAAAVTDLPPETKSVNTKKRCRQVLPITKYLWDDTGNSNGQATIRIDTLPVDSTGSSHVEWKDANVVNVQSEISNNGNSLLVTIRTGKKKKKNEAKTIGGENENEDEDEDENGTDYELHFPQLYKSICDVKTSIVKPNKRLLVKLTKKKDGFFDTSYTQAWPQPSKPKTKTAGQSSS